MEKHETIIPTSFLTAASPFDVKAGHGSNIPVKKIEFLKTKREVTTGQKGGKEIMKHKYVFQTRSMKHKYGEKSMKNNKFQGLPHS